MTSKTLLNIHRGATFLAYWDRPAQTFWFATEKQIYVESRAGTTNYTSAAYDYNAKVLEKMPAVFRKELVRLFKSP